MNRACPLSCWGVWYTHVPHVQVQYTKKYKCTALPFVSCSHFRRIAHKQLLNIRQEAETQTHPFFHPWVAQDYLKLSNLRRNVPHQTFTEELHAIRSQEFRQGSHFWEIKQTVFPTFLPQLFDAHNIWTISVLITKLLSQNCISDLRTCTVTELKQQSLTHHIPISVFYFFNKKKMSYFKAQRQQK